MALLNQTQQDYYDGNDFGGYQFVSLEHIITNFTIAYVGEGKIIPKIRRTDIAFHAQRAIQELSFDTFKSIKSQEITLPPSNTMVLPQDYVNYTKVCWVDGNGIERPLYPTKHTSNPTPILQDSDGEYELRAIGSQGQVGGTDDTVLRLDGRYDKILVGMVVSGDWGIPDGTRVISVDLDATETLTLVTMDNSATELADEGQTFTFSNFDGSLIKESTSFVLTSFTVTLGENYIHDFPIATWDVSQIKVGMTVSARGIPEGTTVTSINPAPNSTSVTSSDVNMIFLSNNATESNTTVDATFTTYTDSTTWDSYSSDTSNSTGDGNGYNHDTDIYDLNIGQRYGVDPAMAQGNGTYYIDNLRGLIHFSSNISGKTVILKYISDGLGTNEEMVVHKFAEEAMYKCIAYAILSTSIFGQALVPRFKKEKFAATRQAKLRLSNIKIEELTQLMRGKSKWIKH
mgnify:CR=1 FL=1